ncbi:phage infection protein [Staphylococcus saccharolyticus]|uniref:Phage infection protein n=1 Tax=Staphylococcus saccharolyticus TaxID=33028 RepID=A0A380H163_9STAP|nr:phage infection protein [Staphylococcus saccharolyticus]
MSKTQKIVMDSKKSEMKQKVESGKIPAQQAQKMKEKWTTKILMLSKLNSKLL